MTEQERLKNYKWDKSKWITIPEGASFWQIFHLLKESKDGNVNSKS